MTWIDNLLDDLEGADGLTLTQDAPEVPDDVVLVPEVLTLRDASVEVLSEAGNPLCAELRATATIGEVTEDSAVDVDVLLTLPSLDFSLRKTSGEWDLGVLLRELGLGDTGLHGLAVTDVALSGSMRTGLLRAGLAIAADEDWNPGRAGDADLSLTGLRIEVGLMGGSGGGYAAVTAAGRVGGLAASVSGTFTTSPSGGGWVLTFGIDDIDAGALLGEIGWDANDPGTLALGSLVLSFTTWTSVDPTTGSTATATELEVSVSVDTTGTLALRDLLSELARSFGGDVLDPPDFLGKASITDADLTFRLDDGGDVVLDVRLAGRLGFDYADPSGSATDAQSTPEIVLHVRIGRSGTDVDAEFAGRMAIGGDDPVELSLDFGTGSDGSTVVGAYRPVGSRAFDLGRLAPSELGLPAISAPVAVEQLVFAWQRESTSGSSRYLLSLGLAADSLNAEVPIVGKLFPDPGLSIRAMITAASTEFGDAGPIDAVLIEGDDPLEPLTATDDGHVIRRGLTVRSEVDLGSHVLPLAFEQSPESPGRPVRDDGSTASGDTNWTEVQRSFGPVHLARAGIGYADDLLTIRLDASITLGGLRLSLQGLAVRTPLTEISPQLDLAGLGVELRSGAVEVAGLFLRSGDGFVGSATIRAQTFSVQAFGALSEVNGAVSLFVFAAVNKVFGGPAAFYVTGIAGGFGYNRDFLPPALEDVADHAFLAALGPGADRPHAAAMLTELVDDVPPRLGSYWVAAGLDFESFKLVRSQAVVLVRLDREIEILLIGRSVLSMPARARNPYVSLELGLRATVRPAAGELLVEGQLTEASYVIDPATTIRGGFAFAVWFGNSPHRGDFVLTVGGYHPALRPPAHYPTPARLELSWTDGPVALGGWAYFALTPSCVMVGGQLEATYREGGLFASFTMSAHFLVQWKPFAYDIQVGVSIYAAFTVDTIFGPVVLDARLSADVHLWGPEFAGRATIASGAFSFDVEFGEVAAAPSRARLSWADFRDAYLPADDDVCSIQVTSGFVDQVPRADDGAADGPVVWIVDADALVLATSSVVPASRVFLDRSGPESLDHRSPDDDLGIHPMMGAGQLTSEHTISLWRIVGDTRTAAVDLDSDAWEYEGLVRQNVPAALWSDQVPADRPAPSADVLRFRPVGLDGLRPVAQISRDNPRARRISELVEATTGTMSELHLSPSTPGDAAHSERVEDGIDPTAGHTDQDQDEHRDEDVFNVMATRLTDDTVDEERSRIVTSCTDLGLLAGAPLRPVAPQVLAAEAHDLLAAAPMLGDGTLGGPAVAADDATAPRPVARPDLAPPEAAIRVAIALLAEVNDRTGESLPPSGAAPAVIGPSAAPGDHPSLQAEAVAPGPAAVSPQSADRELTRLVMSSADVGADAAMSRVVAPGTTTLFEITRHGEELDLPPDVTPPRPRLEIDDEAVESRVVMLNRYGRVLSDRVRTGAVDLDGRVAVVAVSARTPRPSGTDRIVGWRGASSVLQVGPRTFLVEGGTMTTEVEQPGGVRARRAVAVIGDNARRSDGEPAGRVRTTLSPEVRTIAVFVRRSATTPAPGLGSVVEVVMEDGTRIRLLPRHLVHEGPTEVALLFGVPDEVRTSAELEVETTVTGERGWTLNGVIGWAVPLAGVRNGWVPGHTAEIADDATGTGSSTVRIVEAA